MPIVPGRFDSPVLQLICVKPGVLSCSRLKQLSAVSADYEVEVYELDYARMVPKND